MYRIEQVKVQMVRESLLSSEVKRIKESADAYQFFKPLLDHVDREHFMLLVLDAKHAVTCVHTVSIGSLSLSIVHPREVFKVAILANAAAVMFAHNHPSGDPTPSPEDRILTDRLVEAGVLLGIPVLDHIILGDGRFVSFADKGWLK